MKKVLFLVFLILAAGLFAAAAADGTRADTALVVTAFGAKGDGVTDDTAAIRKAVEALEKGRLKARHCVRRHKPAFPDAPFAALVFPPGTYRITESVVITGDAMLLGEGDATIVNAAPDKEGFYVRDCHNLIVRGLTFVGGLCQIRMWTRNRDCSYLHIADCVFRSCRGTSVQSVSYKASEARPSVAIETAYGEERGIPFNNSTLMIVERSRFEGNATALRLYSDGLTVRDCAFAAPARAAHPQLDVGSGGHMGVEMYFRDLTVDYPSGAEAGTAAVLFRGGRGIFENVRISASGDLTAFRSVARFSEYHKPSCLDLRGVRLATGAAPVFSMAGDEFPNRVSVYGLVSEGTARQRLFAFDREPTRASIDRGYGDPTRLMQEPPEQSFAFVLRDVDESRFDPTLPAELRQYVRKAVPAEWKRPLARPSGSTFSQDLPAGKVFAGAPVERLLEDARAAGGGTVLLPADWQDVKGTLDVPDNTRITCRGRAGLRMKNEDAPLFRVADGVSCVFENLMLVDGLHAVEALGERGRVRLLDCTLLGQKAASIFARSDRPAARAVEISGGQAYTPYLYRGNAAFTVDGYWYEESTERGKGENRPSYSALVNEPGGEMFLRDFLGVPCYFQHTPKREAYVFGSHTERRGEFRWVDNFGTYVSVNMRYGGEWGGLTPLYHFGRATTWIEGGNVELGNVYMKSERAVVVADSAAPDVTIVDAASGHHIEPFQVFRKTAAGGYEVARARLVGNYPFQPLVPVWPAGRGADAESSFSFTADFVCRGREPVRLDLEASCRVDVWLNGVFVGVGPVADKAGLSRQARFPLAPAAGRNRLLLRTRPGKPGYLCARVVEGRHVIARTDLAGDFSCGLPLEERVKPPRRAKDEMPPAASVSGGIAEPRAPAPNATDETARWQREIDRAAADGGGRVVVPRGAHEVGQLALRSGVELHLSDGARLLGLPGTNHYPRLCLPFSEGEWGAVVLAYGVTNVAITGRGTIDGRGGLWPHGGFRPRGLFFADSANIRLTDFTFRDAANWGIVLKRCDGVTVRRVTVSNHANTNNDGIDIEARNVRVLDSTFDAGDDAICLKSNDPGFTVENVLVSNCVAASHCNGLKLGTASHGTMRSVRFLDCRTTNPRRNFRYREGPLKGQMAYNWQASAEFPLGIGNGAINVECVDGGTVEDVVFDGIEAEGFRVPIFVRGNLRRRRANGVPPGDERILRDIVIRNVRGAACSALPSTVTGAAGCEPERVTLENVEILCRGERADGRAVCEPSALYDGFYPDASMFRFLRLPAYGLYIDRADVTCRNVNFSLADAADGRPAVYTSTPASQAARARLSGYAKTLEITEDVAANDLKGVLAAEPWEMVAIAVRQGTDEADGTFKRRVFALAEAIREFAPRAAIVVRRKGTGAAYGMLETSPYGFRVVDENSKL